MIRDPAAAGAPASVPPSPLAIPIFRAVWLANVASNFGGLIQAVAAAWMMTALSGSPRMIALIQASTTLPLMLLSLFAGAIADNLDRRRIMLVAQSFMLVVSAGLALATWAGVLSPWLLLMFTFMIGCGTAMNASAWQASVGDLVPRPQLSGAIALNSMGFNIARSVGPALGGVIVATLGAAAAFLLNALSYLGLIGVLLRWRPDTPPQLLPREHIATAMATGVRYVALSPQLRVVLLRALLFGIPASGLLAMMPLVARDLMHGGAMVYGLLSGAFGFGAVGGAWSGVRLRRHFSTESVVRLATLALAAGTAAAAVSPWLVATIPAMMLAGAGWVLALSSFNVTMQMSAPRWVVARALAIYQMAAFGGMAVGSWIIGSVAERDGLTSALLGAAVFLTGTLLLGLYRPLPQVDQLNLDPLRAWNPPDTAVAVEPSSGPVAITIQYHIDQDDIPDFLAVMRERRRVRRRDGARAWRLLRDLADPTLWVERYNVPTWLDYIRHNQRRTQADADNIAQLLALHRGDAPPIVHRRIELDPAMPTLSLHDSVLRAPVTDPAGQG